MKADLGDIYSPWFGTKELLQHGRNPYSAEVSHEIQIAYYGHPLSLNDAPSDSLSPVVDEQRFAYPIYVVFLIAPSVRASFAVVHVWALVLLAIVTVLSIFVWLQVLRWRPGIMIGAAIMIYLMSSPQIVHGLRLRQLGLWVAFLIALAAWCVVRNFTGTAGALLAFATIKPQMILIPLLWFLQWSAGDLRNRWGLPTGFFLTLLILMGSGCLILPGWPHDFMAGLLAYRRYAPRQSLLEVAFGPIVGMACAALAIVALLVLMWTNRRVEGASKSFTSVLALTLTISTLAMPLLPAFNQVMLILPGLLILSRWTHLPRPGQWSLLAAVAWPLLTSIVLLFFLPSRPSSGTRLWILPSYAILLIPFLLAWMQLVRSRPIVTAGFEDP